MMMAARIGPIPTMSVSDVADAATAAATRFFDAFNRFLLMRSAIAVSAPLLWLIERRGVITPFGGVLRLSHHCPEPSHRRPLARSRAALHPGDQAPTRPGAWVADELRDLEFVSLGQPGLHDVIDIDRTVKVDGVEPAVAGLDWFAGDPGIADFVR